VIVFNLVNTDNVIYQMSDCLACNRVHKRSAKNLIDNSTFKFSAF